MAPIENKNTLEVEENINMPAWRGEEAKDLYEIVEYPEPIEINYVDICRDLSVDIESKEWIYLRDTITWLNNKMKQLNNNAEQETKKLPSYFKNAHQMLMTWNSNDHTFSILSQGEIIMKFEIGRNNESQDWSWLSIYMRDLFLKNERDWQEFVDLDVFKSFALGAKDAEERWLEDFADKYTNQMGYIHPDRIPKSLTKKDVSLCVLLPKQVMSLSWVVFNSSRVTINTLFRDPKPSKLCVIDKSGKRIEATRSWNWYVDKNWKRPIILSWYKIEHIWSAEELGFEELQSFIETNISWKTYSVDDLFPWFENTLWKTAKWAYIRQYMAIFASNQIKIHDNKFGMRTYVDMDSWGYFLHVALDNLYGDRPYNRDIKIPLQQYLQKDPSGKLTIDMWRFKTQLAKTVERIATTQFVIAQEKKDEFYNKIPKAIEEKLRDGTLFEKWCRLHDDVRTKNEWGYAVKGKVPECSRAAQESALNLFWVDLPSGHGKSWPSNTPEDKCYIKTETMAWNKSLATLWPQGMYEILSKYLDQGCTLVDIWYNSKSTYWHRNLAYYCSDTKERYILDPVAKFWWTATPKPIPLAYAMSHTFKPVVFSYYKSPIGVYQKMPKNWKMVG